MIVETHVSLETFLRTTALGGAPVAVSFDTPTKPWTATLKAPTVNCFLYDVRENQAVKHTGQIPLRDSSGRVVGHRPVPRYLDHCYLVTTWAPQVQIQHKLLSMVVQALLAVDRLPRDVLKGALAEQPRHVVVSVAQGVKRGMLMNLGGEQRLAVELELAVPWPAGPDEMVDGHVEQAPRIALSEKDPASRPVPRRPAPPPPPRPAAVPEQGGPAGQQVEATSTSAAPPSQGPPPDPSSAASAMLAKVATTLLVQLVASATPPTDGPPHEGAPAVVAPTAKGAAKLGAQVGARVAALAESAAGRTPASTPQAAPSPLQLECARLGATVAANVLATLQKAVAAGSPPSPQDAAALGTKAGAALAAKVVDAVGAAPATTAP